MILVPRTLLLLISLLPCMLSCPLEVQQHCQCDDLHNGVALSCVGGNVSQIILILQKHQAQLGLIQSLTFRGSTLNEIPSNCFAGLYIKRLDMSALNITNIDDNAFGGITPVMQELVLTHNNLTHIPTKALDKLKSLLKVDLSNNSISDLSAKDALPHLPKLFDLNLGSNSICNVHKTAFENVKNTIQAINLGHNCLTAVPASALRGFKQLQAVHLHHNNISILENLAFMNLPVLNLLNLANNNVSDVKPQAFLNVPNLRYLYLTGNTIKDIIPHQFTAFEKLEMIDLTNNAIEKIPKYAFSNLQQLKQLYLGSNDIKHIEEDAFVNSSIVILVLSNNHITKLDAGELRGLPQVQQVSFKNNQISSINPNAFFEVPSLVMIDLSENQLTELPASTFEAQINLLLIDLSKNKIMKTPYNSFSRRVGTVLLQENPSVCTEKIHMIQDGVGVYVPNSEDLICGGIPHPPHQIKVTTEATITEPTPFVQNQQIPMKPSLSVSRISARPIEHQTDEETFSEDEIDQMQSSLDQVPRRPNSLNMRPLSSISIARSRSSHSSSEIAHRSDLPRTDESSVQFADSSEVQVTTARPPRRYTDIADNPNIIHPFPVPFLKRGPHMSKSSRISSGRLSQEESFNNSKVIDEDVPTLPPSIVMVPREKTLNNVPKSENKNMNFEEVTLKSQQPIQETKKDVPYELEGANADTWKKLTSPTTIIILCISVVAFVMLAVFVGLCVAKHRSMHSRLGSSCSDSSTQRTNAYVAAQAAHVNAMYDTADPKRSLSARDGLQPWIYTPGPAYQNYYK